MLSIGFSGAGGRSRGGDRPGLGLLLAAASFEAAAAPADGGLAWGLGLLGLVTLLLVFLGGRSHRKRAIAVGEPAPQPRLVAEAPAGWSLELLRQLEWARVESLCEEVWRAHGHAAMRQPLAAQRDISVVVGGPDDPGTLCAVLRCEPFVAGLVGINKVEALERAAAAWGAPLSVYYGLAGFSDAALGHAEGRSLRLLDAAGLQAEISALPEEVQRQLLDRHAGGDYMTPSCPRCGERLRRQPGAEGRPAYWVCPRFPDCRGRF